MDGGLGIVLVLAFVAWELWDIRVAMQSIAKTLRRDRINR